jgi:hypothetical protein
MNNTQPKLPEKQEKKPDEKSGFFFSTSVKITDLSDNKVILQKRGDQ